MWPGASPARLLSVHDHVITSAACEVRLSHASGVWAASGDLAGVGRGVSVRGFCRFVRGGVGRGGGLLSVECGVVCPPTPTITMTLSHALQLMFFLRRCCYS